MNRHPLLASLLVVVGAAALRPAPARACGGFFREENHPADVVAMSDVRVVLVQAPGRVDQLVQIGFQGSAARFAWVYPVAGNPAVSEVKDSPFEALERLTRPRLTIRLASPARSTEDGGCGCGSAADMKAGRAADMGASPPVKVWQSGQVGAFDYVVITATKVEDMTDWLGANGFTVPPTARGVLEHYVGLGWYFVAMKVSMEQRAADVPATTVVRLSYSAAEVRYPLRMVSLSPAATTSVEVYLVSANELKPASPFAPVDIDAAALRATSETTHNYDQLFVAAQQASPRAMVREYAGSFSPAAVKLADIAPAGSILTRYRASFVPSVMDQDLAFVQTGHRPLQLDEVLPWPPPATSRAATPPYALLAVAALVLARRLRRRS